MNLGLRRLEYLNYSLFKLKLRRFIYDVYNINVIEFIYTYL